MWKETTALWIGLYVAITILFSAWMWFDHDEDDPWFGTPKYFYSKGMNIIGIIISSLFFFIIASELYIILAANSLFHIHMSDIKKFIGHSNQSAAEKRGKS